jgi:hypothetical protein
LRREIESDFAFAPLFADILQRKSAHVGSSIGDICI